MEREVEHLKSRLIYIGGAFEAERLAEKERRIEQVGQMAMMRIVKRDLALGWSTWHSIYEAHAIEAAQGAAGRIAKPKLAAAVGQWRRDWESTEAKAAQKSHSQRLKEMTSELKSVKAELAAARQAALGYRSRRSLQGSMRRRWRRRGRRGWRTYSTWR